MPIELTSQFDVGANTNSNARHLGNRGPLNTFREYFARILSYAVRQQNFKLRKELIGETLFLKEHEARFLGYFKHILRT